MNSGGSLLAFAAASEKEARVYAAIAANLWSTYLKSAMTGSSFRNEADGDDLRLLILPCEEGVVAVTAPSTMLLCLIGDSSIELGLLKAKVNELWADLIVKRVTELLNLDRLRPSLNIYKSLLKESQATNNDTYIRLYLWIFMADAS
jgi:hypothetical protein